MANDNRSPAGQLKNGILDLRLGLSSGVWYPEDVRAEVIGTPLPKRVTHRGAPDR
jgi:hypothetical protein